MSPEKMLRETQEENTFSCSDAHISVLSHIENEHSISECGKIYTKKSYHETHPHILCRQP